ncbi:hypothetical protein OIV83_005100 [Microbotryomycetes sp. JL201]|nr:hypothetical protein OIV83_005100 [Microbotryomycetes sp. JL201]
MSGQARTAAQDFSDLLRAAVTHEGWERKTLLAAFKRKKDQETFLRLAYEVGLSDHEHVSQIPNFYDYLATWAQVAVETYQASDLSHHHVPHLNIDHWLHLAQQQQLDPEVIMILVTFAKTRIEQMGRHARTHVGIVRLTLRSLTHFAVNPVFLTFPTISFHDGHNLPTEADLRNVIFAYHLVIDMFLGDFFQDVEDFDLRLQFLGQNPSPFRTLVEDLLPSGARNSQGRAHIFHRNVKHLWAGSADPSGSLSPLRSFLPKLRPSQQNRPVSALAIFVSVGTRMLYEHETAEHGHIPESVHKLCPRAWKDWPQTFAGRLDEFYDWLTPRKLVATIVIFLYVKITRRVNEFDKKLQEFCLRFNLTAISCDWSYDMERQLQSFFQDRDDFIEKLAGRQHVAMSLRQRRRYGISTDQLRWRYDAQYKGYA